MIYFCILKLILLVYKRKLMKNKETKFILKVILIVFLSSCCVPVSTSFFKNILNKKNTILGVGIIGLLLHYWYFKKPKKVVRQNIEEKQDKPNMQEQKINVIINIPQEDKPDQGIIISQENLENGAQSEDSLMWDLQQAAIDLATVTDPLKNYELPKNEVDLGLKMLNETNIRLAEIISKGKIENKEDEQFSKEFIKSAHTIINTIVPKIEEKMKLIPMVPTGNSYQIFIKTLTGRTLTIQGKELKNTQDNHHYFSTADIFEDCIKKLNGREPLNYSLSPENCLLIIAGKSFKNNTFVPVEYQKKYEVWHLIFRLRGVPQN